MLKKISIVRKVVKVMTILVLEIKKPRPMWEILFSTHHTDVGLLYIITSIAFLMGGALALVIRTELLLPGAAAHESE
jgi:heme/copper-type cytochrome/quinol oxidase subunit 1